MKRNRYFTQLFLLIMACMLMTGCRSKEKIETAAVEAEEKTEDKEMVVAVNVDGSSSELPFESVWMNRSKFWGGLIFQGLLIADDNISNVKPDLCEEYIISADGRKYTFSLKENLLWHDGKELTAEDIVWSIQTYLKVQETNGYVKKGLQEIVGAQEFENGTVNIISGIKVHGNDITINLREDDAGFLAAIAQLAVLPKHCLEGIPLEEFSTCEFWEKPIGSGPYKIVGKKDNKEAVLVVNEDYSGKIPEIKKIRYKVLEYPETDYFDFAISSDPDTVNKFIQNPLYNVIKTNHLYYRYLIFNLDKRTGENEGLLQNPDVRKALMRAIDREKIIQEVYGNSAIIIDGGIPKDDSWYLWQTGTGYSPQLAQKMLEAAEFDFDKKLILTHYSMDELSERLVEKIAECWRNIGINVEVIPLESDSTNKLFVEADWYDVALKNLSAVDYTEWYFEYSSENQLWSEILKNRKEFDDLINCINHSSYANELCMLYDEIQKMENEMVYKIPLAIVPQYVIYNKEHLYIPEMEFPNLWYYYDLEMADWSLIE